MADSAWDRKRFIGGVKAVMKKRSNLVVLFDRECPLTDAEADRQLGVLMAMLGDEGDFSERDHALSLHFDERLMSATPAGELVLH